MIIISKFSGHTLFVKKVARPAVLEPLGESEHYSEFWVVKNWTDEGPIFFYLGKGHPEAPRQIVVWYGHSGKMWPSYGTTIQSAIEGAQKDGWMFA